MRRTIASTAAAGAVLLATGAALAAPMPMHPRLAARLSGMGEHGIVNFESQAAKGRLCWTFDVMAKGVTGATIRDAHGMIVAHLGMHYATKGCAPVTKMALEEIEARPGAYRVWVDTKGHPGDLRGKLFAGMAHM